MFFGFKWRAAPMARKAITPRPEREDAAEKRGAMQIFFKKSGKWFVNKCLESVIHQKDLITVALEILLLARCLLGELRPVFPS